MNVINIEERAFYELFAKLADEMKKKYGQQVLEKWVDGNEAMSILKITSKTTLQRMRDEGLIRYSQPMTKVILYDRESIMAYIERHAKNTF